MTRPTASELISLLVEIEDDPQRRSALGSGWSLFEAVRNAGLFGADEIEALAASIGELVNAELLDYRSRHGGTRELLALPTMESFGVRAPPIGP